MASNPQGISCCFDEESAQFLKDYRKKGLSETAKPISSFLAAKGLSGAEVLELGCGIGGLALQLLKDGASSAVGVDLSPKMLEAARSLAAEEKLSDHISFKLGDAATAAIPPSDFVVLDKVICCYPDPETLLDNSSAAASRFYAISVPDDRRALTRILKAFLPLQAIGLRGKKFRFYIHPVKVIMQKLQGKGFEVVHDSPAGRIWSVVVFAAPGTPSTA